MAVSNAIQSYLSVAHVYYQVLRHNHTCSSYDSACAAHVAPDTVVKAVMLREPGSGRFAMALMPASHRLKLAWLPAAFAQMQLASEEEFTPIFGDCVLGAVPGFGQAFQIDMVWDEALLEPERLFFEAGDHEALIAINQYDFRDLFGRYDHAIISMRSEIIGAYHARDLRGIH